MKLQHIRLPKSTLGKAALGLPLLAVVIALFLWRGPSFTAIGDAFASVEWQWVAVAIALNLLSVVARALAWTIVIRSAMKPPHPAAPLVFSAFSVGLFANAVLPGRIGELARVAVLTRKLPERKGAWATLVGTVFAHRVFDVVPVVLLVLYVVATANIPTYARSSLVAAICVGIALFAFAFISARRPHEVEGWRRRAGRDGSSQWRGRGSVSCARRSAPPAPCSSRSSAGSASSSPCGRRCARSTSTRRFRRPVSSCC